MKCRYCKTFYLSEIKPIEEETKKKKGSLKKRIKIKNQRICFETGRIVSKSTEGCEKFQLKKFFMCKKNGYYVSALICQNRRRPRLITINAYIPCKRCKQWKEWKGLFNKVTLKKKPKYKVTLKKKSRPNPKRVA